MTESANVSTNMGTRRLRECGARQFNKIHRGNAIPTSPLDQFGTLQSAPDNPDQDVAGSFQLPCLFAEMKDQNAVSF